MPRVLIATVFLFLACGEEINIIIPIGVDAGVCTFTDAVDASFPDATVDATSVPDASESTENDLGKYCDFGAAYPCTSPLVCGGTQVCTTTCGIYPYNDHDYCILWNEHGVCSRVGFSEGRCYIGCFFNADCPTGTYCVRSVDSNIPARFSNFCSAGT